MRVSKQRRTLVLETLESRRVMAVGGGFTDHGLQGTYYNDSSFGSVAFTRKEVRLDFDWGTSTSPGGSNSPAFRTIETDNYSARWTGSLIAKFSETYDFFLETSDQATLEIKADEESQWTTIADRSEEGGELASGSFAMQSGSAYDIRVSYVERTGAAKLKLSWQSKSTPLEVIDPITKTGINNPDGTAAFANLVNSGRNRWEPIRGDALPEMDSQGWPMSDAWYILEESLNQGLGINPLNSGRIDFSFRGKADVNLFGNVAVDSLTFSYDSTSNVTTGSMRTEDLSINVIGIGFQNTSRTGEEGGPGGITDLKMMRPTAPDATTTYDSAEVFTSHIKESLERFSMMRFQLVANQQQQWSDRTLPTFFNQARGSRTVSPFVGDASDNGWSWEHIVMLANETGRDLMLSVPVLASGKSIDDSDSYVVKLANLIRYGSDGIHPYTSPQSNPAYPPLNSNLHVYLELGNELWNFASVFYVDWENLNQLTRAAARENGTDFAAINFDGLSTSTNVSGEYDSISIWRLRMAMLRTIQISNVFRSVFGDTAMPNGTHAGLEKARIRPVYQWQYANYNQTAEIALDWAERYFNKTASDSNWSGPARPINYFLYGGGGASYYGAVNGNGLTDLISDAGFDSIQVDSGYNVAPENTSWVFEGEAGIARDAGPSDDIPPAFNGSQVGYLTDLASMTTSFTVPADHISNRYAFSFKAHNRRKSSASASDEQNLRVYLDYGTEQQIDLTARTFSQANGYTPPSYDGYGSWMAKNVFWHQSEYYYTKDVALAPGSTHTITIRGMGDIADLPGSTLESNQTAFIEDVRVTSVDKIFRDGIPVGGAATGQPIGQSVQATMNASVSWAAAFGLAHVAYEGGWSLGGDDGGSYIQLRAKYSDPRTIAAQRTYMDFYHGAGGVVNVLGTYAQWPSWSDYYAEQGLIDLGRYPIIQGIESESSELKPTVTNGSTIPQRLLPSEANAGLQANLGLGRINTMGGWISWNIVVPVSAFYRLSTLTTPGSDATFLVDNELVATGASLTGSRFLTEGLHTLMVRSNSGAMAVEWVQGVAVGASSSPDIVSLNASDGVATISWRPVRGATGYVVHYGTEPGKLTSTVSLVGSTNTVATIAGLKHNQRYFFGVSSRNASGLAGLPSNPRSLIHLMSGQSGELAIWDFARLNAAGGVVPSTLPASSISTNVVVGELRRGNGLIPASDWVTQFFPGRFSSFGIESTWAQTFSEAIAKNEFVSFTISPSRGKKLNLDELQLQGWLLSNTPAQGIGLTYSVDGGPYEVAPDSVGLLNTEAGITFDLRSINVLKNVTGTITFRIYQYGADMFHSIGIGLGTQSIDMLIRGSNSPRTIQRNSAKFENPWQNPINPLDVSGSEGVGPIDVLLLINSLNRGEDNDLSQRIRKDDFYYDVDGDSKLTPLDVLTLINAINEGQPIGEGEPSVADWESDIHSNLGDGDGEFDTWYDLSWLGQDEVGSTGKLLRSGFRSRDRNA